MEIPFFRQETDYTCGVACLRMVLAFYGTVREEPELVGSCGTTPDGTTADGLAEGARALAYQGMVCEGDLAFLRNAIGSGNPPIAFLSTASMSHYPGDTIHAVVVVDVTDREVTVNDPLLGPGIRIPLDDFLQGWEEAFVLTVLVAPP